MSEQKTIIIDFSNGTTSVSIDLRKDAQTLSAKLTEFFNSCRNGENIQLAVYGTYPPDELQSIAQRLAGAFGIKIAKARIVTAEPPFPGLQ